VTRLASLFWDFAKADFNWKQYLLTLAWASSLLALNYKVNLENGVIDMLPTNGLRFAGYLSLYSIGYYGAVLIATWFKGNFSPFKNTRFWIASGLGLIIFSADSGFVFHQYLFDWIAPRPQLIGLIYSLLTNGIEFVTIALPLFLVNMFYLKNRQENLGVNSKEIDLKPFFIILACIAPFIFFSAYESGLNSYYPTFKHDSAAEALGVSKWIPMGIYELVYGLDFFNVELVFRGFFVIGMTAILGKEAVVPMAVFYCCIHFGKPGVEAVSSIFGGYVLGAITYQTRSILGGVIVHVGLAWMMEMAAFLVKGTTSS
jgi:hypothetical protein